MTTSKMMAHMMASMISMMANPIANSCGRMSKSQVDPGINKANLAEVDEVDGPISAVAEAVLLGPEAETMPLLPQAARPPSHCQPHR
jgi:hypothetical protein